MMNPLLPLLLLAAATATATATATADAETYPTPEEVEEALKKKEMQYFKSLPLSKTVWAEMGEGEDYELMPTAVGVKLYCPCEMPKKFPVEFIMEKLLPDRFDDEVPKYDYYKSGDKLPVLMINELSGVELGAYVERSSRRLRGSGGEQQFDRQLGGGAQCPKPKEDCAGGYQLVSNMCMATGKLERRLSEDPPRRRLNALHPHIDDVDLVENRVEYSYDLAKEVAKSAEELRLKAREAKKDGQDELAEVLYQEVSDLEAQSSIIKTVAQLSQQREIVRRSREELLAGGGGTGPVNHAIENTKEIQKLLKKQQELQQDQAKEAEKIAVDEEKFKLQYEQEVDKYRKKWPMAKAKVGAVKEETKAVGMMEEALTHVIEYFNNVYDIDCFVKVERLA